MGRWNSPVNDTIDRAFVVNGSYYLQSAYEGFDHTTDPDNVAPNDSQPYLTAVARSHLHQGGQPRDRPYVSCGRGHGRGLLLRNYRHGRPVCEKGDQLGMFHFGGSTH